MPVQHKSFLYLNRLVHEKCKHFDLFEGKLFNYYKIVQHGLVYSEKSSNKLLNSYLKYPLFLIKLIFKIKSLRNRDNQNYKFDLREVLIIEKGRYRLDELGNNVSMYFHHIIENYGRNKVSIINTSKDDFKHQSDYFTYKLKKEVNLYKLNKFDKMILSDVLLVKGKIIRSGLFSKKEIGYITSAFHVFLEEFILYNKLFYLSKSKVCFFVMHYHNEGLLASLRINGIKSIELQHGLISSNDLYYVYPKRSGYNYSNCLFADKLFVYGDYWKEVLSRGSEYEGKVSVCGDYTFGLDNSQLENCVKENVIFIGAQKNMHDIYVPYLINLCIRLQIESPEWTIVTKLHPSEKNSELYYNALYKFNNHTLIGNESNLFSVLRKAKIQVSIYSTTFFDALGFGVLNLSIQNYSEYNDYAKLMVDEGVAFALSVDENPVTLFKELNDNITHKDRSYYYKNFDFEHLLNAISN